MRLSEYYLPTLKEKPAEAEIPSHQLLLRAGFIRKLASGIYSFLPIGWRVIRKIMNIVKEEMDKAGALEVFLPAVQPAELWHESGRWNIYGKELLRFKDRNNRDFCLGPTHEEVIVDLVRGEVRSYKQLPINLYQMQTKFRDEARPRFGLLRAREFIMKDAYSFDKDWEGLDRSYKKMYDAYVRIFKRCGLDFVVVEAETGAIGGDVSHEFMVWAANGEDVIVHCTGCGYAANIERASFKYEEQISEEEEKDIAEVYTPSKRTIEEVSAFLGIDPSKLLKTLIYKADGEFIMVLVPGDREVNEAKLKRVLGADVVEMATYDEVYEIAGASVGFVGPVSLKKDIKIIADRTVYGRKNWATGANKEDYHIVNVNYPRDFKVDEFKDVVFAKEGDRCPVCGEKLRFSKGIEVGHIFKLGTKYSEPMKAYFLDEDGKEKPFIMGCYGIGVTRIAAAVVEQSHDNDGIIWPISIAPFEVYLLATNVNNSRVREVSEKIYAELLEEGIEVIYDDRDERAGVKFKDADLIGIPIRITVGERKIENGVVEIRLRRDKTVREVGIDEVVRVTKEVVASLYSELVP